MEMSERHQEEAPHEVKPQLVGGLTDTVFGVSITLLAGSLSINSTTPTSRILQQLGGFAAAFLLLAIIWLRRFQLLRWMRVEPLAFIRLNFALLALVVSYTYVLRLFTLSEDKSTGEFAFFLFALLSALVWGVMAGLAHIALRAGVVMSRYQRQAARFRRVALITCAGFALAAGLVFVSPGAASIILIASFSIGRLSRLVLDRKQRREERKQQPRESSQITLAEVEQQAPHAEPQ